MKAARVLGPALALLLTGTAIAQVRAPTHDELVGFRQSGASYRSYSPQPLTGWEVALRRELANSDNVAAAADRLAPRYGLTAPQMRTLVQLWMNVDIHQYDGARRAGRVNMAGVRRDFVALLAETRRAPLVLQAAAESLDNLNECNGEDFQALMAGATDPGADAWTIADTATCGENYLRAAAAAPDRALAPLIRLANYGSLKARDALPLFQWLTQPSQLARIDEAGRPALSAWLFGRRASLLFETGLTDQAVALLESLPADLRQHVLSQPGGSFTALADGRPITISLERADQSLLIALAAAYAMAGRNAEAEPLLAAATRLPAARHAFDCAWQAGPARANCARIDYWDGLTNTIDLLLIDHLLHHPGEDPYPLAEAGFSGMGPSGGMGTAELRCRIFTTPDFAEICDSFRASALDNARLESEPSEREADARQAAALATLPLPGFADMRAAVVADFRRLQTAAAARPARPDYTPRTIEPAPSPFAEQPLPATARGSRPEPVRPPAGTSALPEGFLPVRFERDGQRAVMISVSQTFDPTGEVSQGGYWVHLSHDGGRSWEAPLYTGLAQNFPYVVPSASRLPMLQPDRLDLEVEVAELDTASITYPPVGLRTRRRANNLYLSIPLAALSRDTDGDGISDIAATRLLLDRARRDGGTPFIVGSDAGAGCTAPTPERAATIALLERVFSLRSAAIVEPVDRPAGDPLQIGSWRGAAAASSRPVFIQGDPADYRCLRPDRLMVVYGAGDIAALERFRPDFHPVEMPKIVYNRAHDRGYVRWSAGWQGGTFRLRLVDGHWVFDEISSWIT